MSEIGQPPASARCPVPSGLEALQKCTKAPAHHATVHEPSFSPTYVLME